MSKLFEVIIDDREPEEFVDLFRSEGADNVVVQRLKIGDFCVNQRWVFERKTMRDLCASLIDGRLFRQAYRMLKASANPVVILQGGFKDAVDCNVSRESLQGALITLSVFFNIPILRAVDDLEVVKDPRKNNFTFQTVL